MSEPNAERIPRVAILASAFHPHKGGVEELVRQLAHALAAKGGKPTVFTMRWPKSLPAAEVFEGLPVYRFAFRAPDGRARDVFRAAAGNPGTMFRLLRTLRRERCELLHVQCVSASAWFAVQASRVLRIPLVVTLQGELTMDASGLYQRSGAARHTLRQVLRYADAITACSQATLTEAERWVGFSFGSRGRVIHNGVRVADFETAIPHDEGGPYLLAVGRLVPQKGFDVLLEAMAILVKDPAFQCRLLIAGDGPERASLERFADDLALADRVRFLGATDRARISSLFRGAEAFVLPSRHEPFGIVNLEAMAAGVPIVATAVGGVPEFVVDRETGLLVEPDDSRALARGISRILSERPLRDACVINGSRVAAQHDWAVLAAEYTDVYRSVLGRSGARVPVDRPAAGVIRSRQRELYEGLWGPQRSSDLPDLVRQQHFAGHLHGLVLDVGCGDGSLQRSFPDAQIVGADQSLAGLRASGGTRVRAIAEALPFRDSSCDSVVISEVLEHVGDPRAALEECRRVLRGRGTLIATVPTVPLALPEKLFRRLKFGVWPGKAPVPMWDPEHERRFRRDELDATIHEAGFVIDARTPLFGAASTTAMYFLQPRLSARAFHVFASPSTLYRLDRALGALGFSSALVVATRTCSQGEGARP